MDGLAKSDLEHFVQRANDVILMKLIRRLSDVDDSEKDSFHPELTHQFFGESENIFGFKGLRILMYFTASRLKRFVSVSFKEKIPAALSRGVEPDDVLAVIREHIPGVFTTSMDQFCEWLADEAEFRPLGEKLNQFAPAKGPADRTFEVYGADMTVAGFREAHELMQTWLKWFIDGASYIDVDDERWDFFTMYERQNEPSNGSVNGRANHFRFTFVGFCTVYNFYAYPDKLRPRISQFLILPPFQRLGLGAHLLQSVYDRYRSRVAVVDIAVEDPAENFSKLRDFVDARNCLSLAEFSKESLSKGWTSAMALAAQAKLKLNRNQTRRVYEILKLRCIDRSDAAAYRDYRLEVKKRLNVPFLKMKLTETPITDDVRIAALRKLYEETEEEYLSTIEKLAET